MTESKFLNRREIELFALAPKLLFSQFWAGTRTRGRHKGEVIGAPPSLKFLRPSRLEMERARNFRAQSLQARGF